MKQLLLSVAVMIGLAECSVLHARTWTYPGTKNDNQTRTVTNDEDGWALTCTSPKNSGGKINITAIATIPEGGGVLDLTGDFVDQNGDVLTLNKIDGGYSQDAATGRELIAGLILPASGPTQLCGFHGCANLESINCFPDTLTTIGNSQNDRGGKNGQWGAFQGCTSLKKIPAIPSSLTTIYDAAFQDCTSVTEIEGEFLPDTVTKVGRKAFLNVPIAKALVANGLAYLEPQTFSGTLIPSATFGAALVKVGSHDYGGNGGPFANCSELASVTFDPECKGLQFVDEQAGQPGRQVGFFKNCPKLTGTFDASVFTNFITGAHFSGTGIEKLIVGRPPVLPANFFDGMASLTTVVFKEAPPETISKTLFSNLKAGQSVTTFVDVEYADAWGPYSNSGVIDGETSFWSQDYVGNNYSRLPLRVDIPEQKWDELGQWIYDPAAGTITDGTWRFAATANGKILTVGACEKAPDEVAPLDFSGHVSDVNRVAYWIGTLDTHFGESTGAYEAGYGDSKSTEAGLKVGSLKLPTVDNKIDTIMSRAFACCENLQKIEPMLPNTIKTIGMAAFYKVPAAGDLDLTSVEGEIVSGTFYYCTGLTSVTFGPKLTKLESRARGTFAGCTSLTNVVFDADMRSTVMGRSPGGDIFAGCTKLEGTIDLSGFGSLGNNANQTSGVFSNTKYDTVIVATNITTISTDLFKGMSDLTTVRFLGCPTTSFTSELDAEGNPKFKVYGTLSQTITTEISKKNLEQWAPYMEGGVINGSRAYFDSKYLADGITADLRPVKVFDVTGIVIFFR